MYVSRFVFKFFLLAFGLFGEEIYNELEKRHQEAVVGCSAAYNNTAVGMEENFDGVQQNVTMYPFKNAVQLKNMIQLLKKKIGDGMRTVLDMGEGDRWSMVDAEKVVENMRMESDYITQLYVIPGGEDCIDLD